MGTLSKIPCRRCELEFKPKRSFQIYCSTKCNEKAQRIKRQEYLDAIKLKKGCARCGYKEAAEALQFNHLDPETKSFNIGECKRKNLETINKEIDKCEVLCANCHAIYTKANHHSTRMGKT